MSTSISSSRPLSLAAVMDGIADGSLIFVVGIMVSCACCSQEIEIPTSQPEPAYCGYCLAHGHDRGDS